MPTRPYRPSGKHAPGSIPALFAFALLVGVLAGVAEAFIGRFLISLVIVFPLLIGLAAGAVASWRVGLGKVRAPVLAATAGLLGGLAGQAATHVMDYQFFRSDALEEARAQGAGADLDGFLDGWLVQQTGSPGFVGFVKLQAREGVTIKRGSGSGIELKGLGAYILWLVELLLAGGIAAAMAGARARQPFCEHCLAWYDLDEVVARGDAERWKQLVAAAERDDAGRALAERGAPTDKAHAAVHLVRCSRCEAHEPVLRIVVHTRTDTKKPAEKKVYESLVRQSFARALIEKAQAEAASGASGAA